MQSVKLPVVVLQTNFPTQFSLQTKSPLYMKCKRTRIVGTILKEPVSSAYTCRYRGSWYRLARLRHWLGCSGLWASAPLCRQRFRPRGAAGREFSEEDTQGSRQLTGTRAVPRSAPEGKPATYRGGPRAGTGPTRLNMIKACALPKTLCRGWRTYSQATGPTEDSARQHKELPQLSRKNPTLQLESGQKVGPDTPPTRTQGERALRLYPHGDANSRHRGPTHTSEWLLGVQPRWRSWAISLKKLHMP